MVFHAIPLSPSKSDMLLGSGYVTPSAHIVKVPEITSTFLAMVFMQKMLAILICV